MYTAEEKINLSNLGDGAANELFERELDRVLKDILDPNTEATAQREINLKLLFKPDDERDLGATGIKVSSKLAGSRVFVTKVAFGRDKSGHVEAREIFSGQQTLFDDDGKEKVTPIIGKEK